MKLFEAVCDLEIRRVSKAGDALDITTALKPDFEG